MIADAHARYFETGLEGCSLLPGDEAELGEILFDDWLARTGCPSPDSNVQPAAAGVRTGRSQLMENEFRIGDVPPGSVLLVGECAVFNIEGGFCATQAMCTHKQGPLSEGSLDSTTVTCPLHGARVNVWTARCCMARPGIRSTLTA